MASVFDPQAFLDAQQNEANEKRPPLPESSPGDENGLYTAMIGEIKPTSGEKDGKPWLAMVIPLAVQIPVELQYSMKLPPQLTLTDRAFIDLNEQGAIDNAPGRNRSQRAYREATGMNRPGEPFSWRQLQGKVVKVKVKHEMYQGAVQERINSVYPA